MSAEEVVGETAADTTTTNSKSTEGKKVKKPNTIAEHLKSQKDEVTADKVLTNHIKTYVEGHKRMYLGITKRHGQVIIKADNYRLELLNTYPDLKEALKALFVDFEDDDEDETVVKQLEEEENIILPPLFCPFGDKTLGWNAKNVAKQTVVYLNILDYGKGCTASVADKKWSKPAFFPPGLSYQNYKHPTQATLEDNEDLIKGIFNYFNLDIKTYCKSNVEQEIDNEKPEDNTDSDEVVQDLNSNVESEKAGPKEKDLVVDVTEHSVNDVPYAEEDLSSSKQFTDTKLDKATQKININGDKGVLAKEKKAQKVAEQFGKKRLAEKKKQEENEKKAKQVADKKLIEEAKQEKKVAKTNKREKRPADNAEEAPSKKAKVTKRPKQLVGQQHSVPYLELQKENIREREALAKSLELGPMSSAMK